MTNRVYFIFVIFFIFTVSVFGQLSEGGLPPSFIQHVQKRSSANNEIPNYQATIDFDVNRLIWEDSISQENKSKTRVAQIIPVNLNMDSTGMWTKLKDTDIWQLSITAKGAKGIIFSYKDFYIPKGAKLFIYNEDKSQILGGYNNDTHPNGGIFATEMIEGESVTLEYVSSSISEEKPRIEIDDLGYVYDERLLVSRNSNPNNSSTWKCMVNINCPQGALWQKQKRGVVMQMFKKEKNKYWWYCSGSLVNNTAEDGRPLVLTASHCYEEGGLPEQTIFYFNYENESCSNGEQVDPPTTRTLVGAKVLMQSPIEKGGDGFLMSITTNVPEEWHPYYNGWDVRNVAANSGVVIHHPNGDLKKITTYNNSLVTVTYPDGPGSLVGASNAHWKVVYDGNSITQGGSSGAPIFNEDGLIIGALSGGSSTCSYMYRPDLYAKLWYNWNQYALDSGNSSQKMQTYLDPLNTGVQTLQGLDPNPPVGIDDRIIEDYKELVIFPNPAEAELNINTSSLIKNLQIYDLNGRIMYKIDNYNSSTLTIPISSWQKGIYTISIQTELKKMTDKFIKK